jgi:hypothetical protein
VTGPFAGLAIAADGAAGHVDRAADVAEHHRQPSRPARSALAGEPPTPTQTGSGCCTARGATGAAASAGRCRPDQVT